MSQSPFVCKDSSIVLTSFPFPWTPGIFSEWDVPITHCLPQHNGLHHTGRQNSSSSRQWGAVPEEDTGKEWEG